MATYAITGSSGYVGTRMTRLLLDAPGNHRVIGFDVRPPRIQSDRLEFHNLDIRDPKIGDVLKGRDVASLLHFAFVLDPLYDEKEMTDIDLGGTRNVLDIVLKTGIKHLLATSSTTAYGALADNPVPLREEDPTRAVRAFNYAYDKRLMDEMLRAFQKDHPEVKVCTIRPCIVLGPNVSNYIATQLLNNPVMTLLDGKSIPSQFVHEDDLVRLIHLCVEKQAAGIFNAVGEGTVDSYELARIQKKRAVKMPYFIAYAMVWATWKTKALPFSMPPGILDFYRYPWIASGEKARRELDFTPKFSSRQCFEIILERKDAILKAFNEQMKQRGKR
ncbi:MAG: NAD-dependent epimerase/dehydratase family protein [Deltaproteobacteria bacterium]|nr:NAD-dependent epimerase/dehydratase family protein [Deltaproteobacteria bacterium]